ncbi:hypothetical protein ACLBW8_21585 [Pseudomonas sp. M5A4_2d]
MKEEPIKVRQTPPACGLTCDTRYENSANDLGGSVTYRFCSAQHGKEPVFWHGSLLFISASMLSMPMRLG